jgi:imidazole glycerol-phosphate synthase subunit HisF
MIVCSRIIPAVLMHNRDCVQTKNFKRCDYLGDILNICRILSEKSADEIMIFDISGAGIDFEMLTDISSSVFMPITYGGNISSLHEAAKLFKLGIEKISVKSLFFQKPSEVKMIVEEFGSQAVSLCIDYKGSGEAAQIISSGQNEPSSLNFTEAVERAHDIGIGEFILQSIDRDGLRIGYDIDTLHQFRQLSKKPIVIAGGCANLQHMVLALSNGASATSAGSLFSYLGRLDGRLTSYPTEKQKFTLLET